MKHKPSFHLDEVFPIIEKVIAERSHQSSDFVTHKALVDGLLQEGGSILKTLPTYHRERWWASIMVQWFSQKMTMALREGTHEFDKFERQEKKKAAESWTYKLRLTKPITAQSSVGPVINDSINQ
jgi:hypothetical protein